VLVGRVVGDEGHALLPHPLDETLVRVDHQERGALGLELPGDRAPHAPIGTHDEVARKVVDPALHTIPPRSLSPLTLEHPLRYHRDGGQHEPDADRDHREGEHHPSVIEGMDLAEPHRRQRGDRHVQRVEEPPPLEQHVAGHAVGERDREPERGPPDAPPQVPTGGIRHRARA